MINYFYRGHLLFPVDYGFSMYSFHYIYDIICSHLNMFLLFQISKC